nr:hypothetical protein CFP56_33237 [Quercus suber]
MQLPFLAALIVLGLFVLIITLLLANELNPEVLLAALIVLGLFVLIITLFLALLRFQQVESVIELISEVLGTLDRIVVLLLRLIRDLHQIISMADEGFQLVVSVLELIHKVVGSLVNFVDLLLLLIRICRRI